MLPEAIHALLVASPTVVAGLATYQFTTGVDAPAVFTMEDGVPDDAAYPCIYIQQVGSDDFGCRENRGGGVTLDVTLYGPRDRAVENDLEDTARAVWRALDRADLCLDDSLHFQPWGCIASLPMKSQDDAGFPAYRVPVRTRVLEV